MSEADTTLIWWLGIAAIITGGALLVLRLLGHGQVAGEEAGKRGLASKPRHIIGALLVAAIFLGWMLTRHQNVHFDFSLLLVLLTIFTGIVWLLDVLLWQRRGTESREHWSVEYSRSFFPVLLVVLLLRSFVVEPFRIPSGSMIPTLKIGDFILVNKFAYGLRLPVLHTAITNGSDPRRGDVVVFRYPLDPSQDYIKRVIGLPGDRIRYANKTLFINGNEMLQAFKGAYELPDERGLQSARRLTERLGEREHDILVLPQSFDKGTQLVVPSGHYFVMGDNRDRSSDSRRWGLVPERNLVGKAFFIWMNWGDWGRVGTVIR